LSAKILAAMVVVMLVYMGNRTNYKTADHDKMVTLFVRRKPNYYHQNFCECQKTVTNKISLPWFLIQLYRLEKEPDKNPAPF
jgi:hypothetical protein